MKRNLYILRKMDVVILSLELYSQLTDGIEMALDEADRVAMQDTRRMPREEVYGNLRMKINVP